MFQIKAHHFDGEIKELGTVATGGMASAAAGTFADANAHNENLNKIEVISDHYGVAVFSVDVASRALQKEFKAAA